MGLQKEVPCQDGALNDHHLMQVIVQVNVKDVITESLKDHFCFFNFIYSDQTCILNFSGHPLSCGHLLNLWKYFPLILWFQKISILP